MNCLLGQITAETVKGVRGNLYGCAEPFLSALLKEFSNKKIHSKILYKVIVITLDNNCLNVHSHNMTIFWNAPTNVITEF